MKSIKNQYIDLKNGKLTETQFMRNVRMTLPEYISNVTLFKQAEKILLNKGIISEIKVNEAAINSDYKYIYKILVKQYPDIVGNWDLVKSFIDDEIDNIEITDKDSIFKKFEEYRRKKFRGFISKMIDRDIEIKEGMSEEEWANAKEQDRLEKLPMDQQQKIKKAIAMLKAEKKPIIPSLKESKDTSATGYFNQDGKEQYGKFDELDNMNAQEIMAGYVLEKIDNPDKDKKEIIKLILKNLKKDSFYYTNYKLTGTPGEKPVEFTSTKRKPGFDQMKELDKKSTNLKDEKNKTQVVKEGLESIHRNKLKEAVRKVMKEMFDGRDNLTDVTGEDNIA